MIKKIEILVINIFNKFIGIDCSEIKRVISDISLNNESALIKEYEIKKRFFRIGKLLNIEQMPEYNSLVIVDSNDGKDIIISTPSISEIISIDLLDILIIPEFIRKKQDPVFIWGFYKNYKELISLITFTFFINKG